MEDFWWFMYDFFTPHLSVGVNLQVPAASRTRSEFAKVATDGKVTVRQVSYLPAILMDCGEENMSLL